MSRKNTILRLRQTLINRRTVLLQSLAAGLEFLSEPVSGDVADAALISLKGDINCQLAETETEELSHINRALDLIRLGQYGTCESCQKPIPAPRLVALPYATRCIECQRDAERQVPASTSCANWDTVDDSPEDQDMSIEEALNRLP